MEVKKKSSTEIKEKVTNLETCPLCKQNVTHEHKSSISNEEDKKISEYDKNLLINKNFFKSSKILYI